MKSVLAAGAEGPGLEFWDLYDVVGPAAMQHFRIEVVAAQAGRAGDRVRSESRERAAGLQRHVVYPAVRGGRAHRVPVTHADGAFRREWEISPAARVRHPGRGLPWTDRGRGIDRADRGSIERLRGGEAPLAIVQVLEVQAELAHDGLQLGAAAPRRDPLISRDRDAREDPDERDDDHQLDHRETACRPEPASHGAIVRCETRAAQHPRWPTPTYFLRACTRSAGKTASVPNFSAIASRERFSRSRFFLSASNSPSWGAPVCRSPAWTPVSRTGCASTLPRSRTATRKISAESSVG